ncbi:MAG: hypothetical protein AB1797_07770 [bacterium]
MHDVLREMKREEERMIAGKYFGQWTHSDEGANYPEEVRSPCLLSNTGYCNILSKLVCKYQGIKCPLL